MPEDSKAAARLESRREFLKVGTGAIGGTVLMAGCSGEDSTTTNGNGNINESGSGGGGGSNGTRRFRLGESDARSPPDQRHFNPWNPTESGTWHPGEAVFDRLAVFAPLNEKVYPVIAQEWEMVEDDQLEVEIRDDYTWHNGDTFTVHDYILQTDIEIGLLGAQNPDTENPHPYIQSIEAVDDFNMRIQLQDPVSNTFALRGTIASESPARGVFTKSGTEPWTEWRDRLQGAEGDELDSVISDITTSTTPHITEGIGNGPFQVTETSGTEILLEKYEDYPNADGIGFSEMSIRPVLDSDPLPPYTSGNVDAMATNIFPVTEDLESQLPEGHSLTRQNRLGNYLITFNCGAEQYNVAADPPTPFKSRAVRQAVAHVYSRSDAEELLQGDIFPYEYPPCRAPHTDLEDGQWDVGDFTSYGNNNTERAAELLRSEGYEQDNGTWLTPDGNTFEIEFMGGQTLPHIQSLIANLNDFGIETRVETVDDATFNERRNQGDFHIMSDGAGADSVIGMWSPTSIDLILGSSRTQFGFSMSYPMPIGDPEGSSGEKTVDVMEQLSQWRTTSNDDIIRELMWGWNQNIPQFEVLYFPAAGAIDHGWELNLPEPIRTSAPDAEYLGLKMDPGIEYTGNQ